MGKVSTPQHEQRKLLVTSLGAIEAAPVQAEKFTAWEIKLERRKVNEDWSQQYFYTCNSLIIPEQVSGTGASLCRMKLASFFDVSLCGTVWGDRSENSRTSWDVFLPLHPQNCFLMGSSRWKCLWAQGTFVPWKKEDIYLQKPLIIDWKHKVDEMFSEGWFTM